MEMVMMMMMVMMVMMMRVDGGGGEQGGLNVTEEEEEAEKWANGAPVRDARAFPSRLKLIGCGIREPGCASHACLFGEAEAWCSAYL